MSGISISYPGSAKALAGAVTLPASKSISNRVLIIRALTDKDFSIDNLSEATDTRTLLNALKSISNKSAAGYIDVQDAGTAYRFLTAYLSCRESQQYLLKGSERMHKRPIADLVNALKDLGADISYTVQENYPPLLIKGKKLNGGRVVINTDVSSQFVSALCLIAPLFAEGLVLEMRKESVSYSYIQMTLQLMSEFGIQYTFIQNIIHIPPQSYKGRHFSVENDWSSASFFYAMAMIADAAGFQFDLLKEKSVQGDSYIKDIALDFGIQTLFDNDKMFIKKTETIFANAAKTFDLNSYPDLAIPLIVACAVKYPGVTFTGLKHLQYKESDRIAALTTELKKVNVLLNCENDLLSFDNVNYKPSNAVLSFNTYSDHRIAMALSMLALEGFKVVLNEGRCVQKSFPAYFEELTKLGFKILPC